MHYFTFKFRLLAILSLAVMLAAPAFSQSKSSSQQKSMPSNPNASSSSDKIYSVVEMMPSFPGGPGALMKYIADNTAYPESARDMFGTVIVSFVVEKNGMVSNAKVSRSVHPDLDAEAVRVVESMPKWVPGRLNGEAVRVKYNVPVRFLRPDQF